jgi:hypothetical protein
MWYSSLHYSNFIVGQNVVIVLFKYIEHSNIAIKFESCLRIVRIMHHRASCTTILSTHCAMDTASNENVLLLLAEKGSTSTMHRAGQYPPPNQCKCSLEAHTVWILRALCSLQFSKMIVAKARREMIFLSNQEKEKWIQHYVQRKTAMARKGVKDTETAIT